MYSVLALVARTIRRTSIYYSLPDTVNWRTGGGLCRPTYCQSISDILVETDSLILFLIEARTSDIQSGSKSKLLILSEYVNKTEKIGGT